MTKSEGGQNQSRRQGGGGGRGSGEGGGGGGGGGGGRGKKRKRNAKYLQHSGKNSTIAAGLEGFLITCVGGKERQSIREAINLLDQFLESPEAEAEASGAIEDEQATTSSSDSSTVGTTNQADHDQQQPSDSNKSDTGAAALPATDAPAEVAGPDDNGKDVVDDDDDSSETSGELDGEDFGWVKCRRLDKSSCAERSCGGGAEYGGDELAIPVKGKQSTDTKIIGGDEGNNGEASKSFDELLAAELEELRNPKKVRFVGYETGCKGVIFVRMNSDKSSRQKGPKELAEAIVRDAATSKKSRSRFCMRLLPVELTCYASAPELQKVAEPLIARHFPKDPKRPSYKFAVICETRANTNLNKMELIHTVAKMVPEPHSVDLKNPDKTILIQVVKTACAVGVVQDFKELAKYNLRQLTSQTPPALEGKSS